MAWIKASEKPLSYHWRKLYRSGYHFIEGDNGKRVALSPDQRRTVGTINRALNAPAYLRRVLAGAGYTKPQVRMADGYLLTPAQGIDAVRNLCRGQLAVYKRWRNEGSDALSGIDPDRYEAEANKTATDPLKHVPYLYDPAIKAALVRYFLDPFFVGVAARYLGLLPALGSVRILYSPNKAGELKQAQQFHLDPEGARQVKVFIALRPTDQDCGPLTFVPSSLTRQMLDSGETVFQEKRVKDKDIARYAPPETWVSHTGEPGAAVFIDTSNCFHFGSRPSGKPRLLLFAQYFDPYCSALAAANPLKDVAKKWAGVDPGDAPHADLLLGRLR